MTDLAGSGQIAPWRVFLLRPGTGAEYCDQPVCLSVCLSICASVCPWAYLWNRWTDLHEFFVQFPCGRGSVLLWQRLCTSSFIDGVTSGCIVGRMAIAALRYRGGVWCIWIICLELGWLSNSLSCNTLCLRDFYYMQ